MRPRGQQRDVLLCLERLQQQLTDTDTQTELYKMIEYPNGKRKLDGINHIAMAAQQRG